jgi:FkbM family methyltransferase
LIFLNDHSVWGEDNVSFLGNSKQILRYVRYELPGLIGLAAKTPYEHLRKAPRGIPMTVKLQGRPFSFGDARTFYGQYVEIMKQEVYRFTCSESAPLVLDCGANCGLSTLYFKRLYPEARIVAVEADPQIFRLLQQNVRQQELDQVSVMNKAIWSSKGCMPFYAEGKDSGRLGIPVEDRNAVDVETIPLDSLVDEPVDLLKIDIEGAESEVLFAFTKWHRVKRLFVEYHSFEGQEQTLPELLSCLKDNGFRVYLKPMFSPNKPFCSIDTYLGMDLQLNIYALRV